MSDFGSIFKDEPGTVTTVSARLPAPPAAATPVQASNPLAVAAGAVTALAGGLVWAGVVIATHYDVGVLAAAIGAATGLVMVRVAGGTISTTDRVLAAGFSAGAIVVGKYVIFAHAVRVAFGRIFAGTGISVSYFNRHLMGDFVHHIGHFVRPIYLLWIALAIAAAVRVTAPRR